MEATAKQVRVRIAPSPTGFFHVGNARTAIFNWLFARQKGGKFILRIEDTDRERSKPEYEQDILDGLRWLGLDYDYDDDPSTLLGAGNDDDDDRKTERRKNLGFYRQSERTEIYKKYLEKLLDEGRAYWCFCSKEDLEVERQAMMAQGLAPKYSGRCKNFEGEESEKRVERGERGVIRLKVPETFMEFEDLVRGKIKFDLKLSGDVVIARSLEAPLYNFSAVIDDYEMEITHVIRGEDHLANTPKQIVIQEMLGLPRPIYGHLPLILNPDRSKLSKRFGDSALKDYREKGYLPEAVLNFLALLGWHPPHLQESVGSKPPVEEEILSRDELIEKFNLRKIQKGGAAFNQDKLDWLNAHYLKSLDISELVVRIEDFVPEPWFAQRDILEKALAVERERMKKLTDFKDLAHFFFELPDYQTDLLIWNTMNKSEIVKVLEDIAQILQKVSESEDLEKEVMEFANRRGRGEVLWPLRVALSGLKASPGPFEILKVLGRDEALKRIKTAKDKLNG